MVDEPPPRRQRVAAYALLRRGADELLLSRLAPHVRFQGWTLPGGGVDHGEHPRDALRREIYEEAGLHAEPGRLRDVYHAHYTGARPDGLVEDYHAIALIFEAELLPESRDVEPHVVDVGGSTDRAAWVTLAEARTLSLSGAALHALGILDEDLTRAEEKR
ncbi:MAG TPA: NUDIX domain-containing protein [Marmoricola sp.]|nr:NUDIX domain-containing protein [Marmoricola sp.]